MGAAEDSQFPSFDIDPDEINRACSFQGVVKRNQFDWAIRIPHDGRHPGVVGQMPTCPGLLFVAADDGRFGRAAARSYCGTVPACRVGGNSACSGAGIG